MISYLTKSKFLAGMQCPLRLWYQCHRTELIPPINPDDQFRMDSGIEVGKLACQLYPKGVRVESEKIDLPEAISQTKQLMDNESVPAIFEAAFLFENLVVRVDILKRTENGKWNLIEVKSSTGVKEEHIYDVWF